MAGIYIHIPFCKKACTYCDFHFSTSLKYVDEMTDAICKELLLKKDRLKEQVGSIYFGGGTPSVLPSGHFEQIFNTITKHFSVASDAEITIEANPDDLDAKKIRELRQLPVNRFSIGIQSFFDEDLRWMNRAHNASEAISCIKRSQDAGFENLSIDLIYGYPLLTDSKWLSNINNALEFETPHISAYSMTVEPRTILASAIKRGKDVPMNDEQAASQFITLTEQLNKNGYDHYEISNYSQPGRHAVHNTNYWRGVPYLGIGPSAHGFDGSLRHQNIANNAQYLSRLGEGQLAEEVEELSSYDQFNEYIMTSLRTMWGTSLEKLERDFGKLFLSDTMRHIQPFLEKGWIRKEAGILLLTEEGKLFADHIASELFLTKEDHL